MINKRIHARKYKHNMFKIQKLKNNKMALKSIKQKVKRSRKSVFCTARAAASSSAGGNPARASTAWTLGGRQPGATEGLYYRDKQREGGTCLSLSLSLSLSIYIYMYICIYILCCGSPTRCCSAPSCLPSCCRTCAGPCFPPHARTMIHSTTK